MSNYLIKAYIVINVNKCAVSAHKADCCNSPSSSINIYIENEFNSVLFYAFFCQGARVILACRDMTRAHIAADEIRQKSGNGNVVVKKLDLASLQSVRDLARDVQQNEDRLDILINNAGISLNYSCLIHQETC